MNGTVRQACGLLKRCWRTMLLFELVFRLFSNFALFPLCRWLFNGALRLSRLYCLTVDNLPQALVNPLMLLSFAAIFLAFSLTAMVEISCLITCLDAASGPDRAMDVLQMIREGLRDARRLLRPRNLPLMLVTALLMPIVSLPTGASPLQLVHLPWRSLARELTRMPLLLFPLACVAFVALFFGAAMCTYQRYVLEDRSAVEALRGAFALNRGRRLRTLLCFLGWMAAILGGVLALAYALRAGFNRLIPLLVPDANVQYRILLPLTTALAFARGSVPSMACYAFINAVYFRAKRDLGEELPPQRLVPRRDAHRFNALVFYAVALLCTVGLTLYDTQLRPMLARANALEYVSGHPTLIIAHRGYFKDTDENTLSAFQAAIELGVDWVELDVQQTADGVVIVNHDKSFYRVHGVNRRTWELNYDEVRALSGRVGGEAPPALIDVLDLCDPQANFLIELKDNGHNPGLVRAVYDLLTERDCLDRCAIQSSSYRLIRDFKVLAPEVRCGYILSFALGSYAPLASADFFSLDYNFVDEDVIDAVHSAGKDLYVWTLNDERQISAMLRLGADGVITDDVPLAKTLLLDSSAAAPLEELIAEPLEEALAPEEDGEAGSAREEISEDAEPSE